MDTVMNLDSSRIDERNAAGAGQYREGPIARAIEEKTAKLPSDLFLWAAGTSALVALASQLGRGERSQHFSLFVGQWVPTILLLGVYNKIVKVEGSDRQAESPKRERQFPGS